MSPSKTLLDTVVEGNERSAEAMESMQAGFSEVVMTSRELARMVEAMNPILEAFEGDGGVVNEDGTNGGAVAFTQLSEESVESLTSGIRDVIEQVIAEQKKQTEELSRTAKEEGEKTRKTQAETSEKLGKAIDESFSKQLQGGMEDIAQTAGGIGDLFGAVQGGNLGKIGSVLGRVLPALGGVAATIGAGAAIVGAVSGGIDLAQSARAASIQQTGEGNDLGLGASMQSQAMYTGLSTGLDTDQAKAVQQGLISGRAKYGTEEYDVGYQFAIGANQDYGMSVENATQLYTDAVVKGGMSMNELNDVMEGLSETVKNTDMSMDEVTQQFLKTSATWEKVTGNSAVGTSYANQIAGYFQEGSQRELATGLVGNIDWTNNVTANNLRQQYMAQGMEEPEAMVRAAQEVASRGYGTQAQSPERWLAMQPLTDGGKTFWEYVNEGDSEGLLNALNSLSTEWENKGGIATIRKALTTYGANSKEISTPEKIVEYMMGYSEGMENLESGDREQAWGDEWSDIKNDADGVKSVFGGSSLTDSAFGGGYYDLNRAISQDKITSENVDERARNRVLSVLSQEGLVSDEVGRGLDDALGRQMSSDLLGMYEESGDSRDFTEWLTSDEAKGEVQDYLKDYDKYAVKGEEQQKVDVVIGWADGADQVLRAKVENANNEVGRTMGTES